MLDGYILGIIASIMSLSAFSFQIYRVIRIKNTKALSYNFMIWVGIAMSLYVGFGLYINEPVIWVGNVIGVLLNVSLVIIKYRFESTSGFFTPNPQKDLKDFCIKP